MLESDNQDIMHHYITYILNVYKILLHKRKNIRQNSFWMNFHHTLGTRISNKTLFKILPKTAIKLVWLTGMVTESDDLIQRAIKKSTALFIPDWISKTDLHHFIL